MKRILLSLPLVKINPFRVLLVEDNAADGRLIEEMIAETGGAFELCRRASRLTEAFESLSSTHCDLVLVDLALPDSSGIATFEAIRDRAPELPIIVLSGLEDEELALRTVHEGAQDYLVKGKIESVLLGRSMRYAIERSHIERALAQERELLNALLNNIPDEIYFKDSQSRFVRINQALASRFGLRECEGVIGKTEPEFASAEDAEASLADERTIFATGESINGRVERKTTVTGEAGWVLTTKVPLRDRRGAVIGTAGISRDITELKKMEDALSAERNLLRNVIDNLPAPIYVKDAEGRYILDNIPHAIFLGARDQKDVIGKTVFDFFPAEIAERFHQDDNLIIQTGEPLLNREEEAVDRDGNKRWLATTKVPLREGDGPIFGLVCIGRDITQRKLAQERLQQVNEELSGTLRRLKDSHELLESTQLQLIEAEKLKTIGRLAAGVAHEVKNPLAIIAMGLEYLSQQDYPAESDIPPVLKDLDDAVKRADMVIRGMLDYSAPKDLVFDAEDLNSVIKQALLLVRGEMNAQKHRVVKELPRDLPRVKLDRMKIGQVFVNVFTNALHAMPDGGTLTVRTSARQITGVGSNVGGERSEKFRVGQQVVVTEVEDTGHGIPPDKLNKVFDPFFTTKPTGQGTGLGLSVTRSIIDLHGGTIEIANRDEGGARVTLTLKA